MRRLDAERMDEMFAEAGQDPLKIKLSHSAAAELCLNAPGRVVYKEGVPTGYISPITIKVVPVELVPDVHFNP